MDTVCCIHWIQLTDPWDVTVTGKYGGNHLRGGSSFLRIAGALRRVDETYLQKKRYRQFSEEIVVMIACEQF